MTETSEALAILNGKLQATYDAGNPFMARINARAACRVHTIDPLAYEPYGAIIHRGPRLVGDYAVEAFMWAEAGDLAVATGVIVPAGNTHMGVWLPRGSELINFACRTFDLPFLVERVEVA